MRNPVFPAVLGLLLLPSACGGRGGPGSVGVVLGRDDESRTLYVREVPEGLAGEAAGLKEGDRLVMIDGYHVGQMGPKEIREHLRGDVGTTVSLTFLRGNDVHHVVVTRGKLADHLAKRPKEETIVP
ncbi:MAG: PDZ domain-containing protein [Minicystis sp.]